MSSEQNIEFEKESSELKFESMRETQSFQQNIIRIERHRLTRRYTLPMLSFKGALRRLILYLYQILILQINLRAISHYARNME